MDSNQVHIIEYSSTVKNELTKKLTADVNLNTIL